MVIQRGLLPGCFIMPHAPEASKTSRTYYEEGRSPSLLQSVSLYSKEFHSGVASVGAPPQPCSTVPCSPGHTLRCKPISDIETWTRKPDKHHHFRIKIWDAHTRSAVSCSVVAGPGFRYRKPSRVGQWS